MKRIFALSIAHGQENIHSGKKNIRVSVKGMVLDWHITPENNPDRLKVYCSNEKNVVVFQTDIDTVSFFVSNNDTLKFNIIAKPPPTVFPIYRWHKSVYLRFGFAGESLLKMATFL